MSSHLSIALITIFIVVACNQSDSSISHETIAPESSTMTQRVSIKLGEMGPDLAKRYPGSIRVRHQPAGIDFYKIEWNRPRGIVTIEHGKNSFEIEDVLSVQAPQDLGELKSEGLNEFSVNGGMSVPSPGLIPIHRT
jgi:hypothetical protein